MNDIVKNNLRIDLDAPYDEESNKIDVYSSVYWTAESKEEYEEKEELINNYVVETELFTLYAWCDISGYDYWVVQEKQENYVSIDVVLKKGVELYTHEEIEKIKNAITIADDYFIFELM